jgi:hypothetical protein
MGDRTLPNVDLTVNFQRDSNDKSTLGNSRGVGNPH